jgi:hypothetical protein
MTTRHDFQKWDIFIWSAKTLLNHQIMLFFAPMPLIFLSKLLECNFVIIKMRLIIFINVTFFMKKFIILASISQNLVIYHTIYVII